MEKEKKYEKKILITCRLCAAVHSARYLERSARKLHGALVCGGKFGAVPLFIIYNKKMLYAPCAQVPTKRITFHLLNFDLEISSTTSERFDLEGLGALQAATKVGLCTLAMQASGSKRGTCFAAKGKR